MLPVKCVLNSLRITSFDAKNCFHESVSMRQKQIGLCLFAKTILDMHTVQPSERISLKIYASTLNW